MKSNTTQANIPEIDARTIHNVLQCLEYFDKEGTFFIDASLNFIYYNSILKNLFGLEKNQSTDFFKSFTPIQTGAIKVAMNKCYKENITVETEIHGTSKSKSCNFKLQLLPYIDTNKNPIGIIGKLIPIEVVIDSTQTITENPNPIFRVLHSGEVVFYNGASIEILERLNLRNKIIKDNIFHFNLAKAFANNDRIQYTLNSVSEKAYTLVLIPSKENKYVTVYATDITELSELQMSLIKSRADIKTALNSANQMMVMMNKRMSILAFNNKASVMAFRMSNKYLITGTIASDYLGEQMRNRFIESFNKCVKEGKKNSYETQILDQTVGNKWYNLVYNPVHDDLSDQVIGVCFSAEDITISKHESLKIEDQRNFYETILNNLPSDLAVFNEKHEYLFANPAAIANENIRKWIIGKTDFDYCEMKNISTGMAVSRREIFENAIASGKEITLESEHSLPSGETQYVMRKYSPCYEDGKLKLMIGYGVDISENKRSQLRLIQSEHRYRTLFENNPLMVFIVDKNSNIVSCNDRVSKDLGYSKEEIIGLPILNILPKDQYESFSSQIGECIEFPDKEFTWETIHLSRNDVAMHVEATAKVVASENGDRQLLIVCNNIDIRKKNEILLEESKKTEQIIRERELHDNIINAFSSEVYKLDCVDAITKAITRNCAKLFNAAETSVFIIDPFNSDLRRQNSVIASSEGIKETLNDIVIPAGNGIVGHAAKSELAIIVADSEKDDRHINGSIKPGSEIAVPIIIHNKVWGVIDSENDTKHYYTEKHLTLLKRISEVAAFKISKVLDTLEQKRINRVLIRNNTQLQQYSYIVSHNLRAPIANLLGLSKMFKRTTPCAEINGMIIEKMMASASNIDVVITDLNEILATKKDLSSTMELVEFEPIINSVLLGLSDEIQATKPIITIDLQSKGTIAIKSYITSIFTNLISNALKYRSKDRPCELHIRSMPLGNECVLEFSDNGLGIDLKKHGDKIFGLYKRFHPNINGSGIGLHLVKSQLDAMNGSIEVRSEVNSGSTFTIHFYQE